MDKLFLKKYTCECGLSYSCCIFLVLNGSPWSHLRPIAFYMTPGAFVVAHISLLRVATVAHMLYPSLGFHDVLAR